MIQSVDRAITILYMFNRQVQELGITEMAQVLNLPKSTVHGLVRTLEARDLLAQNPENGKYRLGLKVYELGMAYSSAIELEGASKTVAHNLSAKYDEAVHVAVYAGGMAVFVIRKDPRVSIASFPRVGASIPAHASAVGKVLLAHLPPSEIDKHMKDLYSLTLNTITDREILKKELAQVSNQGYAVDNEEAIGGLGCVAAPIRDKSGEVVAALSLSGAVHRIIGELHSSIIRDVMLAADQISRALGYLPEHVE